MPSEKCGKPAESFIPRWGVSFACVLDKGHQGLCKRGGTCFKHGSYIGSECPLWPECAQITVPAPPDADVVEAMLLEWIEGFRQNMARVYAECKRHLNAQHQAELKRQREVLAGPVTVKERDQWFYSIPDRVLSHTDAVNVNELLAARLAQLDKKDEPTPEDEVRAELIRRFGTVTANPAYDDTVNNLVAILVRRSASK